MSHVFLGIHLGLESLIQIAARDSFCVASQNSPLHTTVVSYPGEHREQIQNTVTGWIYKPSMHC
jgi:hypothetical protein